MKNNIQVHQNLPAISGLYIFDTDPAFRFWENSMIFMRKAIHPQEFIRYALKLHEKAP